jgi:hypothetical protein
MFERAAGKEKEALTADDTNILLERMAKLGERLLRCTVPIFRAHGGLRGSGLLVSNRTSAFLVSAAHVFEPLESGDGLCIFVAPDRMWNLQGRLLRTQAAEGKVDRFDIGVLRFDEASAPPYPTINKEAIPVSDLVARALPRQKKQYFLTGFPATKTRREFRGRFLDSKPYANLLKSASEDEYVRLGRSQDFHIAMPFVRRKVIGPGPRQIEFPEPAGMSGSPVWLLPGDFRASLPTQAIQASVVGIFIEYLRPRSILIATDIRVALDLIAKESASCAR